MITKDKITKGTNITINGTTGTIVKVNSVDELCEVRIDNVGFDLICVDISELMRFSSVIE